MTKEEIKEWYINVCKDLEKESIEFNSPAVSFAAGLAIGVVGKHLEELQQLEEQEWKQN